MARRRGHTPPTPAGPAEGAAGTLAAGQTEPAGIASHPGYRTVLVPIFGEDVGAAAIGRAAKLIGKGGVIHAVFVLAVPPELPLEDGLEAQEAHGRSALESARIQARRAGIRIHTGVIRTRNPGAALVEEARRVQADAIYWSTLHAPAVERRIGPTALHLLSRRPCRVIIETEP